jgi:hypothetical protein
MTDEAAKPAPQGALAVRLAIGLTQGIAVYWLQEAHARLEPVALGVLQYVAWLAPIVALGAYGATRRLTLLIWVGVATAIAAGLGGYDAYVREGQTAYVGTAPPAALFVAAALFILHHLILPAEAERRWRASYERYFDDGWKDAVRLALAAVFVGALWGLLYLGAALFKVIGLTFLETLIRENWFSYPTTTVFFAVAVHVTDVRAGLVRGARTLVLTLLSWLLPILTVIAAGFLAALPFTGLKVLWATHAASGTMLAACAALIILINANYQEGERDGFPPQVLRWVGRGAGLLLAPLTLLAAYGVLLRVAQHGLTPSRIFALACVVVSACYAAAYAWAAAARGAWMKPLERGNWITAQVAVVVVLVLFSPLGDPARYSTDSQVGRLLAGQIRPDAFDYGFLHFHAGRWGRAALKRLADPKTAPPGVAAQAGAELRNNNPFMNRGVLPTSAAERTKVIQAIGAPLPPGFLTQPWPFSEDPAALCKFQPKPCPAITVDLGQGPGPQVVVFANSMPRVFALRDGHWTWIGDLQGQSCGDERDAVVKGQFRLTPVVPHNDLEVAGRRFTFVASGHCPKGQAGFYQTAIVDDDVTDVAIVKPVPPPPEKKAKAKP